MYFCAAGVSFFFFKQKSAYEMRISDWSSDVCSSDLREKRSAGCPCATGDAAPSAPSVRRRSRAGASATAGTAGRGAGTCRPPSGPAHRASACKTERKSVGEGKSVTVSVDLGGRRIIQKKTTLTRKEETTQVFE